MAWNNQATSCLPVMAFNSKKKYRPGLDEPPPTRWQWIVGITGIAAIAGVMAAWFKRKGA